MNDKNSIECELCVWTTWMERALLRVEPFPTKNTYDVAEPPFHYSKWPISSATIEPPTISESIWTGSPPGRTSIWPRWNPAISVQFSTKTVDFETFSICLCSNRNTSWLCMQIYDHSIPLTWCLLWFWWMRNIYWTANRLGCAAHGFSHPKLKSISLQWNVSRLHVNEWKPATNRSPAMTEYCGWLNVMDAPPRSVHQSLTSLNGNTILSANITGMQFDANASIKLIWNKRSVFATKQNVDWVNADL